MTVCAIPERYAVVFFSTFLCGADAAPSIICREILVCARHTACCEALKSLIGENDRMLPADFGTLPLPGLLRTLVLARLLWGERARLSVPELSRSLAVPEAKLRRTLYLLYRLRWVWFDTRDLSVGLTTEGEEYFMAHMPPN